MHNCTGCYTDFCNQNKWVKKMRYVFAVIFFVFATRANALDYHWPNGEIDIVIDPSVESINMYSYYIIEGAILDWNDFIPADITVNFIHAECDVLKDRDHVNCIGTVPELKNDDGKNVSASTITTYGLSTNDIKESDIMISDKYVYKTVLDGEGIDFRCLMIHEAGHWWGLAGHSKNSSDVMFATMPANELLPEQWESQENIERINSAYAANEIDTRCSFTPLKNNKSMWKMLKAIF